MYGTLCNLLMVLEMSREQAHKSLSPSVPWALDDQVCTRGSAIHFICWMGWLTPRGIFLLFSLITSGRSKWEISDDYNSSASRTSCCTQLNWKESLTLKAVCHSNFQIGRVSNLECYQSWGYLKILANDRTGLVQGWPMGSHSLRWALWCLDVIVSKHFGIEFVLVRRRPFSAKYVVCPVQL